MKLFGSPVSPFVRKVQAYMAERDLSAEFVGVGVADPNPEYGAVSPFRKMPAFKDGDFGISDSSAIITYLDAKYPGGDLLGSTPEEKARIHWFDEFCDTMLVPAGGKIFFNRIVMPKVVGKEGNEAMAKEGEAELPRLYDYLEGIITESGFLVGERLSLADLAVASPFATIRAVGHAPDADRYPHLTAWVSAIEARPSMAGPIAHFDKIVARLIG